MGLLEIRGLKKQFDGLVVLDGIDIVVEDGEIQGVIGPNGAGKSTLFNIVSGIYRADSGSIRFRDREIVNRPVYRVARMGVGRTFQVARAFDEMTVLENMLVPSVVMHISRAEAVRRADELLELATLDRVRENPAIEISGGQRKLLEFVRMMMTDPDLILLDEPFNGINPALIEVLMRLVRRLNERGKTFLLISHEIPHVSELCNTVTVLAAGTNIARGTPAEIRENPAVLDAYLGH
ncbi:ABC transporter ATP-binding protein [Chelativorans sp. M5D2P16]|uniref:ABC transporter ATP-binding protein n=1 Tax=Chelativorans sp. M5D2P16 TaxID=3095678 RepID=UPI002ACA5C9F|nr:ABC transporter ATP-binding protein [Chelativorans sp. M5D2P16]MDZ5696547.1 ABC transporter ATP-binding protein [Chelativorans sp. M5D2P16]